MDEDDDDDRGDDIDSELEPRIDSELEFSIDSLDPDGCVSSASLPGPPICSRRRW